MEWTWEIAYFAGSGDAVTAAQLEIDEISYELVDAKGDVVWSAPLGAVRNVLRGAPVAQAVEAAVTSPKPTA